jgi:predicted deacetylase
VTANLHRGGAQYLLRFDDLCPTMNKAAWERFVPLLQRYELKPILAVIPDNQDAQFQVEEPDPQFWQEMRSLEETGATIGLHGYQHLCNSRGRIMSPGLVPFHRETEFAGVPRETQGAWIREGLGILRANGLQPRMWVAPRHGFDRVTLDVLREEGMELISDGLATRPFRWRGMTWIPQQLWGPADKASGLWTICVHADTASNEAVSELELFLHEHASRFTSVDKVLASWPIGQRSVGDRTFHARKILGSRISRVRRYLREA